MADAVPLKAISGANPEVAKFSHTDTVPTENLPAGLITATSTHTLTNKTLTAPKIDVIADVNGNEAIVVVATPSAVNHLLVQNRTTGSPARLAAVGDDPNIDGLVLVSKGTGGPASVVVPSLTTAKLNIVHEGLAGATAQAVAGRINFPNTADAIGIPNFTNANHDHLNAAGAGLLNADAIGSGTLRPLRLGQVTHWDVTEVGLTVWRYAGLEGAGGGSGPVAVLGNVLYALPFFAPRRSAQIDRLAVEVTTGVAATNIRMGLYLSAGGTTPYPSNLVAGSDTGSVAVATPGIKTGLGAPVTLLAGQLYYAVWVMSGAGVSIRGPTVPKVMPVLGGHAVGGVNFVEALGYSVAFAYAALPASFPGGAAFMTDPTAVIPFISMRYSA